MNLKRRFLDWLYRRLGVVPRDEALSKSECAYLMKRLDELIALRETSTDMQERIDELEPALAECMKTLTLMSLFGDPAGQRQAGATLNRIKIPEERMPAEGYSDG